MKMPSGVSFISILYHRKKQHDCGCLFRKSPHVHAHMRIEVSGVWDLLHVGHIRLFERARALASPGEPVTLIVGVHNDRAVSTYKRKPIIPHDARVQMVRSCVHVDEVIPHAPLVVTAEYLKAHRIDLTVHAHSKDDRTYDEMYAAASAAGKFRRIDYIPTESTTAIIRRVKEAN